ncbi:MAG: major capsid protein P2 [Pseudoalteromonas spongiae]
MRTSYRPAARDLDPINKIGTGIRGSIKLPVGMTYHGMQLLTNITNASKIAKVEIELNGDIIKTYTGVQLKMLEDYKVQEAEAGRYVIPFANLDARNIGGIMAGALVTYETDRLFLYVTFGDLSGVTNPSLDARAHWIDNTTPRLFIPRAYETTFHMPKAGKNVLNWDRDENRAISRLHFLPDSGELTRLEIYRDNRVEFESNIADINFDLKSLGGNFAPKAPQADYLHFDPTASGFAEKGLYPTIAARTFKFNVFGDTAGQTCTILVEELERIPQNDE